LFVVRKQVGHSICSILPLPRAWTWI